MTQDEIDEIKCGSTAHDSELLQLAAKAAGYVGEWKFLDAFNGRTQGWYFVLADRSIFSPLTDDGDALRLAVKLRMVVDTESMEVEIGKGLKTLVVIKIENDVPLEEATRRAIVRAAAEIGKAMK